MITIHGRRFTVIGILERKGKFLGQSLDNVTLIPVNSLVKKNQRFNFMVADLVPISPAHIDQAIDQTRETMRLVGFLHQVDVMRAYNRALIAARREERGEA